MPPPALRAIFERPLLAEHFGVSQVLPLKVRPQPRYRDWSFEMDEHHEFAAAIADLGADVPAVRRSTAKAFKKRSYKGQKARLSSMLSEIAWSSYSFLMPRQTWP